MSFLDYPFFVQIVGRLLWPTPSSARMMKKVLQERKYWKQSIVFVAALIKAVNKLC